jgi:hypothetical protein
MVTNKAARAQKRRKPDDAEFAGANDTDYTMSMIRGSRILWGDKYDFAATGFDRRFTACGLRSL